MTNLALGAGALLVLPNFFSGIFGGNGSSGGVGDIIKLMPLMLLGGGALYAIQVFRK